MRKEAIEEHCTPGKSKTVTMPQFTKDFDPISISSSDDESLSVIDDDDASLFSEFTVPADPLDVKPEDIDTMVAQEMSALSMQDREKVYSDVHGVSEIVEETPELIRDSLQRLQLELDKLDDMTAYHTAKEMDPKYVQDESFRLMFLRADLFDASKAATRMGLHFKFKLELFGQELLTTTITQDHLGDEALRVLYSGKMRLMEERDSAGRALVLNFVHDAVFSVQAKLKSSFYLVMLAEFDEETQRRGCVGISFTVGQNLSLLDLSPHRREWNLKVAQLCLALPVRIDAIQICHDSLAARVLLALFKLGGMQGTRLRMREHYGNRQQCLFSLQTFGIPTHGFPMDKNGKILTERHVELLEKRRKLERHCGRDCGNQVLQQVRVGVPRRNDVLFGRGKAYYRHFGNMRLRALVEDNSGAYEATNIAGKQRIREIVMTAIRQLNGRFLRDDGMGWVEVSDIVAGQKVAHAFRTLRGLKAAATPVERAGPSQDSTPRMKRGRVDF